MSKKEFIKKLSKELERLPNSEREKTLAYYDELIEDRKEAGSTEEAAVDAMGNVKTIATEILADAKERGIELKRRGMPVGAKIGIIIASVLIGLSLIGGIVWAAFAVTGFNQVGEFYQVEKYCDIAADGIIEVDFSQYDLYVGQSEDDRVYISYYENKDLMTFTLVDTNDRITLIQRQKWLAGLFFNKGTRQAQVLVPTSFTGTIKTKISTGDTRVDHLVSPTSLDMGGSTGDIIVYDSESNEANFHMTTGDMIIGRCSFKENLSASCTTGDVAIEHTSAENMTVKTTTGHIKLDTATALVFRAFSSTGDMSVENLTADSAAFENTTGDIRLTELKSKSLYAHLTTGEIVLNSVDATILELKATTGSISGTLAGSIVDYGIESHVSTGHNSLPEVFGSGPRSLKAQATTGDIRISFSDSN